MRGLGASLAGLHGERGGDRGERGCMERWKGEACCEYWDEGMVYLGTLVVSVKFWRAAGGRVSWTWRGRVSEGWNGVWRIALLVWGTWANTYLKFHPLA